MSTELVDLSIAYLSGWKTIYDYAEWVAGIDWDNSGLDQESLEFAGLVELMTTEIAEGLRPEADLLREASKFVESKTGSLYTIQTSTVVASSSIALTDWPPVVTLQAV